MNDPSRIVKRRVQPLWDSAWQGGLLIFLVLALFRRISGALWVCVGIPISFMGALLLMPELGVTINIISLFAFIAAMIPADVDEPPKFNLDDYRVQ